VAALTSRRAEAAAVLERRMAAMEAVLASRRTAVAPASLEPEREAAPGGLLEALLAAPPSLARPTPSSGPAAGSGREIMLQGFNWESHREKWYVRVAAEAKRWADDGFSVVWLPPPSDSVSAQGYLPRDLYSLDSAYGTEAELRDAVAAIHAAGMRAVADVVINHRCAHKQDAAGRWNVFGGRLPWDASAVCNNNPAFGGTGNHKTGDDYPAAPNIDHTSPRVREDVTRWLTWLRSSIGFDGWRFDYVKGYSGEFVRAYVDATVPDLAVGEFWDTCGYTDGVLDYNQDAHRQRTINWCDQTGGTAAAFDFTTKGVLQEAMARGELWRLSDAAGRPPGVLVLWPSRAVTFIDNHDTGSTLNHWPFPHAHLGAGYAYILTHPGTPCVFYDHWAAPGLGDAVRDLVRVRREAGLHCRSKVVIRVAVGTVYAATVDDAVAVKIGPGDWSPTAARVEVGQKDWLLEASGHQWGVWRAIK
jgi:alpha-amylase